jgi:dUTP pyrophosphatase
MLTPPLIAVSGTVGSGKSTFTESLASSLGVSPFLEEVERNPFFADPLDQPVSSQLWFLTRSISGMRSASGIVGGVVERPPQEHVEIFAADLLAQDRLTPDEFALLRATYTSALPLPTPNLLIHLEASPEVALARVRDRGRSGESTISLEYLNRLAARYDDFVRRWDASSVLRVHTDQLDVRTRDGFELVLGDVQARLNQALPVRLDGGTLPVRAHPGDAGLDLACAEDVEIPPLERRRVTTGVEMHIPEGSVGFIVPRSSLADVHGVTQLDGPGVIDAGYRGPVHFLLFNTDTERTFTAAAGERLGQIVIVPMSQLNPQAVAGLSPSARGRGGFGSTGSS